MAEQNLDPDVRRQIDALQERYIRALDEKDMQGWLACFDTDGAYSVTAADDDAEGLPLSLMLDDCYERLQDRVTFVSKVWPGAFEEYQTRHFIQPLSIAALDNNLYQAISNLTVFSTSLKGQTSVLIAGRYCDEIRVANGSALFKTRKVLMDTFATPGVVVYPL